VRPGLGRLAVKREKTPVSAPLLLECDRNGRVLWTSHRGPTSLGYTALLGAELALDPEWVSTTLRFTRIWTGEDRILVTAEAYRHMASGAGADLLDVQSRLFRHYLRLQTAERSLQARTKRHGSRGAGAIRQIELERQRLGRELHTGVGQLLAAIRMQLEVISSQLPDPPLAVLQALGRISTLAADALEQVRTVSKRLHPPEWQRLTLSEALRQLWENSGIPQRYEGSLELRALPREPELEIKSLLYRAAQEAVSNLMRHARATRITLLLEGDEQTVTLAVVDNGVGFDAPALFTSPASLTAGIGLRSIRDQAEAVGGKMTVESGPNGTKLEITVPC
jgi:signal transduction histidine kinase